MTGASESAMPAGLTAEIDRTAMLESLAEGVIGVAARRDSDGTLFLLLAGDARTGTEVEELTRAFIWPSVARRRPTSKVLREGDELFELARRLGEGGAVIALLAPSGYHDRCAAAISRLFEVRSRRPLTAALTPRQISAVLRDFEDAVAREDVAAAKELMAEADSTGRLSLTNRSRMEVRVLAASRAWREAIDYAVRVRLVDLHLPAPVEHDMVRAGFHAFLADPLESSISAACDAYVSDVGPRIGDAFRDYRAAASTEARLAWMIRFTVLGDRAPGAAIEDLVSLAPASERSRLLEISSHAPTAQTPSVDEIRSLLGEREDAAVWAAAERAVELPTDFRRDAMVRASKRLEDPVREAQASLVGSATAERLDTNDDAERTAGINGWGSWLQALFEDPTWPEAISVVDAHAEAWIGRGGINGGDPAALAGLVEVLAGEPKFVYAAPRFARAVIPDGPDQDALARDRRPLLLALADAVASVPSPGIADLDTLGDLASAILTGGVDLDSYAGITGKLRDTYEAMAAPPRLARWVVDTVVGLLTSPAPSNAARDDAVRQLVAPLLPDARRARPLIRREVWEELEEWLEGQDDLVDLTEPVRAAAAKGSTDGGTEVSVAPGRSVLLLTLVEAAAARARERLTGEIPGLRVVTDASSVATDHLREHARRADLVVVASRACKHAAYDCVQAEAGDRIAYASGKGWSSLVGAVYDNIAMLA